MSIRNQALLITGHSNGSIRCWDCQFETTTKNTTADSLHEDGDLIVKQMNSMDFKLSNKIPILMEVSAEGILAVVTQVTFTSCMHPSLLIEIHRTLMQIPKLSKEL